MQADLDVAIFIQPMTLCSCKTVRHHKATQDLLQNVIPDFISAEELALHSSDSNPLDYSVWDTGHLARTCA